MYILEDMKVSHSMFVRGNMKDSPCVFMWVETWSVITVYLCEEKHEVWSLCIYMTENRKCDRCTFIWKKTWIVIVVYLCEIPYDMWLLCVYMRKDMKWSVGIYVKENLKCDCYVLLKKKIWSVITVSWSEESIIHAILVCVIWCNKIMNL